MGLPDITETEVILAISEFDRLGRSAFLNKYGFRTARSYFLVHEGRYYDSKAILGVAHSFIPPEYEQLSSQEFSGGNAVVVPVLNRLGFEVEIALNSGSTQQPDNNDWSEDEISLITTDYFAMLKAELSNISYSKTEHRNQLMKRLVGRSNGAIEFKHCNISSVLQDLDLIYISGYKPRKNKQRVLIEAVENYLEKNPGLAHNAPLHPDRSHDPFDVPEAVSDDPSKRIWQSIKQRRGQPQFRANLLKLYEGMCAITGFGPKDVLEAAHIQPHNVKGRNSADNGLLLRADIHTLFDLNLIAVHPQTLKVIVSSQLEDTDYSDLQGKVLRDRTNGSKPNRDYLAEHLAKLR